MAIGVDIETSLWNQIFEHLKKTSWRVSYMYDGFDAGIDLDFIILEKNEKEILLGWTNWFEGEIKCSRRDLTELEKHFNTTFKEGEPTSLKNESIVLHRNFKQEKVFDQRTKKSNIDYPPTQVKIRAGGVLRMVKSILTFLKTFFK